MSDQSFRGFVSALEDAGELRRINETVDLRYEISALLAVNGPGPALLFEDVAGSELPVLGNLLGTRRRIALGLGVPVDEIQNHLLRALEHPLPHRQIADAPCQQVVVTD